MYDVSRYVFDVYVYGVLLIIVELSRLHNNDLSLVDFFFILFFF